MKDQTIKFRDTYWPYIGWSRAILGVGLRYWKRHRRIPNVLSPTRYTEKIQWRKLFDLDPIYLTLSDKIAVRTYVEERVGQTHLIPCLWTGNDPNTIPFETLEPPYVLKSSHGSAHTIIVEDRTNLNVAYIRETARSWLRHCHGSATYELGYVGVPRRLIVEELLLDAKGSPPLEVKAFVFNGHVATFQAISVDGKDRKRQRLHYDRDWRKLPWSMFDEPSMAEPLQRPHCLAQIIEIAERVGAKLDHARVDMYLCDERIFVGEVSMYANSGLSPFYPDEADFVLGRHWQLQRPLLRALRVMLTGKREISAI